MAAKWLSIGLCLILSGCTSIRLVGTIPETQIACYAVRDTGFYTAGILLVCTQDGQVKAASGGAAPGPAGLVTGAVGAAGVAAAGALIGSGLKTLSTPTATVGGDVKVHGAVELVP